MKQIYIPETAKTLPWTEIEDYFSINFNGVFKNSFAKLVNHIIISKKSERLFAYTSMDKLIISNYEPIEWNRDSLHITFNLSEQKWTFEYFSKPFKKAEFVRTYALEDGIEKFDKFIEMIRW
ncbi:MAG: hypothetical protein MUC29_10640 [Pyrinomonadaceae bacterium]|jgi:hypothetical protein|nr:hypothetical protein [Pyrinomonadaceae bacterium]